MKKTTFLLCIICLYAFVGCAYKSELNYTPPLKQNIKTTKVIDGKYSDIWKELVKSLSNNIFVINNLNKESGFINVDFSTNDVGKYIDCGNWNGYFKNLRINETYDFKGTDNASLWVKSPNGIALNIRSSKKLTGKINILLNKINENKQELRVNVRYIMDGLNASNYYRTNWNVTFNSNETGTSTSNGKTECVSKGTLEKQILNYINN